MTDNLPKQHIVDWKSRYNELLESINIGFCVFNPNFIYLEANACYLKMIGHRKDQIIGKHIREIYRPEEYLKIKELLVEQRKRDQYQYEYILPGPKGRHTQVLYSSHIIRNEADEIDYVNVLVTDISELKEIQGQLESAVDAMEVSQKSLKTEKKMLETVLFGIGDCVTIFNQDGQFLLGNPQGIKIRGERRIPLLPLKSGTHQEIMIQIESERRDFEGKIEAIQDGEGSAITYIEILKDITPLIKLREREQEISQIKREMMRKGLKSEMIGVSKAMQTVFDYILRFAEVEFDIMVLGETGVGKEMVARSIHAKSARKTKPFIPVNCGALPETLFESELFGNVKGAYTGAIVERPGLFREALGGTIFLDEIGDISKLSQVKLLRVLQEREVRPVGSSKVYPIDIRVITATNKDLGKMVEEGQFRADLYYRIAAIPMKIPPLRERKGDIILLAEHFILKHQNKKQKLPVVLDHAAQHYLLEYDWPGNIRELENSIKHALVMTREPMISKNELPVQIVMDRRNREFDFIPSSHFGDLAQQAGQNKKINPQNESHLKKLSKQYMEEEKNSILAVLKHNKGNRTLTAKTLGIARSTLWRKMSVYGLNERELY